MVKSGETLSKISNDYGIKLHKLMTWNNLDNSLIKSGQLLKINPHQNKTLTNTNLVSKFTTNNRFSHTVTEGQTLWEISQIYEIPAHDQFYQSRLISFIEIDIWVLQISFFLCRLRMFYWLRFAMGFRV